MKKLLALAVIATLSYFSISAIAAEITLDTLEQFGSNYMWLLVGLGLLCFIELRRRG